MIASGSSREKKGADGYVLIVHDGCRAHELVNGRVAFTLEFCDPAIGRLDGVAQAGRDAPADVTHGLEPAHLVPDCRNAREQVRLLSA